MISTKTGLQFIGKGQISKNIFIFQYLNLFFFPPKSTKHRPPRLMASALRHYSMYYTNDTMELVIHISIKLVFFR